MQANIMQLVRNIFALDSHHTHTGIKQKQGLKQAQMISLEGTRYGLGDAGAYFIFDVQT